MNFDYSNYQDGLVASHYAPPFAYRPFMRVRQSHYAKLEALHEQNGIWLLPFGAFLRYFPNLRLCHKAN